MVQRFDPSDLPASPDLRFESALWAQGLTHLAGLDEAGRGAWAGPVSAGAVILPPDLNVLERLPQVRDSKQMVPSQRTYWAGEIKRVAAAWGVGFASSQEIDALGIIPATRLAMQRALAQLIVPAEHLLIDAVRLAENPLPQTSLIKGDARSLSIAAASVLAKTARDALLVQFEEQYPGYGFARHKGYGTRVHLEALQRLGACPIHRFCFSPIANL
jgi:ribonuclease HII